MKTLGLKKATDLLLHKPGTRMMLMHTPHGMQYFIVPGGPVDREAASKILKRPDAARFDDGLFPGNPQSWVLGT